MLEALIAGERDPAVLADLAKRQMRAKIPALTEALRGRFTDHHAFMVRLYLDRIDAHAADIARLDARIEEAMQPFRPVRELLMSIPGWSQVVADVFIAETGADMMCSPLLHTWRRAGVVPGCDESAGRVKSGATRPGNRHLKAALGVAALSAARTKDTYYGARYRRIAGRRRAAQSRRSKTRGMSIAGMTALVAIEHKMLTDAWHMLTNGASTMTRPRLLHPPPSRANQSQSHQTARNPRLQSHSRTTHRSRLTPRSSHSPAMGHQLFE